MWIEKRSVEFCEKADEYFSVGVAIGMPDDFSTEEEFWENKYDCASYAYENIGNLVRYLSEQGVTEKIGWYQQKKENYKKLIVQLEKDMLDKYKRDLRKEHFIWYDFEFEEDA